MSTEIDVEQVALQEVRTSFNEAASSFNAAAAIINEHRDALLMLGVDPAPAMNGMTEVAVAANAAGPKIRALIDAVDELAAPPLAPTNLAASVA
jgi:hypothetical protein